MIAAGSLLDHLRITLGPPPTLGSPLDHRWITPGSHMDHPWITCNTFFDSGSVANTFMIFFNTFCFLHGFGYYVHVPAPEAVEYCTSVSCWQAVSQASIRAPSNPEVYEETAVAHSCSSQKVRPQPLYRRSAGCEVLH